MSGGAALALPDAALAFPEAALAVPDAALGERLEATPSRVRSRLIRRMS